MLNTNHPASPAESDQQQGVGLIEVLIAVVILSIGFLAAGRMQVQGVRAAQEANVRSQAHFLVKDMADRMRANAAGVAANAYTDADTKINTYARAACTLDLGNPTPCTPEMIAQNDLAEWASYINPPDPSSMTPILPSGENVAAKGMITLDGTGEVFIISLMWSQIINGAEEVQSLSAEFIP